MGGTPVKTSHALALGIFVGWLFCILLWGYAERVPPPRQIPEVVLPPIRAAEPRCRDAGMWNLGNHQKDSVAVLQVCKRLRPYYLPQNEADR